MNYSENTKINKHRRFKFGVFAVALTVFVIAIVIVVNAIFSALSRKYMWYIDMSSEKIFSIGDASKDLLNSYRGGDDTNVDIVFCSPADQLDSNYMLMLVHNLALRYEEEFDFVHVKYVDIINHPDAVDKYLSTSASRPKTTSVILCDGVKSRLYNYDSFYTYDSDTGNVFAFNGEYKFTSGILSLIGDNPIAYFVTGHGEKTTTSELWDLFVEAGYDVRTIDLSKEKPDDAAKVMVINSPTWDIIGDNGSDVNEVKVIDTFLESFGGLMVFMGSETKELPELDALLYDWGIKFETMQVRDYSNSMDVEGRIISATYVNDGKTGSSVTSTIRGLETTPKAIISDARPISFVYESKSYGSSTRTTSAVLSTDDVNKTAVATSLDGSGNTVTDSVFNLMTVTVDTRYIDNEPHNAYVLAVGSSGFADDKYVGSKSYANRDIVYNIMKAFGKKTVPLDIDFKVFDDTDLNCTKAQANRYTLLITVVPAAIAAIAGIYVYTRRRYL